MNEQQFHGVPRCPLSIIIELRLRCAYVASESPVSESRTRIWQFYFPVFHCSRVPAKIYA